MDGLLPQKVEEKLKTLPSDPGVYLMKNREGTIIYVGKARVLKNRVRQYFGTATGKAPKVSAMVENIDDLDFIITRSELEALILEANLIKQYHPYYNILMKDDKQYPYVRIDTAEDFPRIEIVRKVGQDGAKYFGPYIAAHAVREVLDAIYKLFPLRTCRKDMERARKRGERPCLNYQMGRCPAPCAGKISREEYQKTVEEVIDLLSGKYGKIEKVLEEQMTDAAQNLDFERAAEYRDKIAVLRRVAQKQQAGFPDLNDKDIFAAATLSGRAIVQAFFVRKGKLAHTQRFELEAPDAQEPEILESFLKQFYSETPNIPKKIYISHAAPDAQLLSEWLSGLRGSKVELICPQRGSNKKLTDMAKENAKSALLRKEQTAKREYERTIGAAKELALALGISGELRRIECYDISNTQGTDSVASMVVMTDGKPDKREYRRFKIKTVIGPDDFASMAEVLKRRLIRGMQESEHTHGFGVMPDLIIVDGGKGQLSSACEVLEGLGLEDIPIAGLAKREEELFLPGRSDSILLDRRSNALRLVTSIRDEAHRFAITFHRNLREKRVISSELDRIPGVGQKRKKALLDAFGSVEEIKGKSAQELANVPGVDIRTAREVVKYFE